MEIRMIRSEEDLTRAIRAIADLMERAPAPDSEDFERLELLCVLVQDYEQRHHPVPPQLLSGRCASTWSVWGGRRPSWPSARACTPRT